MDPKENLILHFAGCSVVIDFVEQHVRTFFPDGTFAKAGPCHPIDQHDILHCLLAYAGVLPQITGLTEAEESHISPTLWFVAHPRSRRVPINLRNYEEAIVMDIARQLDELRQEYRASR